ncbi:MAG: hypothetical protein KF681_06650 [Bdellovibrionaceae bacterium]|nr:hypothetical protein [Pseudobdellovibrionaceae bacterium]
MSCIPSARQAASFSFLVLAAIFVLGGCASSAQKARKEQRDKLIQTNKLYCEFLNGEQYPDIDVALNVQMAQRCDAEKSFTITSYKTPSEIPGVLYCCALAGKHSATRTERPAPVKAPAPPAIAKPIEAPTAAPAAAATATAGSATATTAAPKAEAPKVEAEKNNNDGLDE